MSSFLIEDWMMSDGLKLKGCELFLYALIHSYTKAGKTMFESEQSLGERFGYSRRNVGRALESLRRRGLIIRRNKHPWLLLYGNLGTGKTALLRALYLLFSKYRHFSESVVMDSAASIVDAYGRYKADDINSPGICYGDVLRADPLLIDELGCEPVCKIFGTDYEPMCEILCRRYERRQVTVITTNLGDDLLCRTYGRRLWDRLNELKIPTILYLWSGFLRKGATVRGLVEPAARSSSLLLYRRI